MFIYFGKRYDATRTGGRVVPVRCDKCGCQYYYQLTRVGVGASDAPYMIGTDIAASSAQVKSERDLQQRLASEAELVPCPSCHWINDELVQGYRLGRHQWVRKFALGVGIAGTALSLVAAWFISIGPPVDHGALPYFLYGGPVLFVSLAAGLFLLRTWLRSRIRPNRGFPRPPKLPLTTPPALCMDRTSDTLRIAKPDQPQAEGIDGWLDFQIGRHQFPSVCIACSQAAAKDHTHSFPVNESLSLGIPLCAACAKNTGAVQRGWLIFAAVGLFIGGMVLALMMFDAAYLCTITGGMLVLLTVAVLVIGATARRPFEAIVVDPNRGVVRLRFRNATYGRLVAEQIQKRGREAI